jgi:hypothetical protein
VQQGKEMMRVARPKDYTKEKLLKKIYEKAHEKRQVPVEVDMKLDYMMPPPSTFRYHFGTFINAVREAGLIPISEQEKLRNEKKNIVAGLKRLYGELGFCPRQKDIDKCEYLPSHGYIYKQFGGLEQAYKIASILYNKRRRHKSLLRFD